MKWFNILRDRLRALWQREEVISDIDREMRAHVELQIEQNIAAGMSPAEAREKAVRSFGNVNRAVDAAYDVKGGGVFETGAAVRVERLFSRNHASGCQYHPR